MQCCLLVIGAILLAANVHSLPGGPPVSNFEIVCRQMMPGHGFPAQPGNGGYVINTTLPRTSSTGYSYVAGQTYTVNLTGSASNQMFRGFLVIAHVPGQNDTIIGQFTPQSPKQQNLDCDPVGANMGPTVRHTNRADVTTEVLSWTAPSGADGTVDFRYTVVQMFNTYYVAQSAAQTSLEPIVPATPTTPVRAPEDYRLTFRTPPGCNVSNCTSFVGIDTNTGNTGVLDIYMEGEALGWVAVGFTQTRNMFAADVVACNRDPLTDMVEVLDTYNAAVGRANLVDATQDVILFNSSFDGTRIVCTVGKNAMASDPAPQDLNLTSPVYILWGIRPNNSTAGSIPAHAIALPSDIPAASATPANPSNGVVVSTPMRNPEDYRITFRQPSGCQLAECNVFVGIDTNTGDPSQLDITMQGVAGGWLAVGFTATQNMFDADVVGCTRDAATGLVTAIDTWNAVAPTRNNIGDSTQDVVLLNSSFINGTISCTFVKSISSTDPAPQDRPLNVEQFIIYGYRATDNPAGAMTNFPVHGVGPDITPTSSAMVLNPAVGTNQPFAGVQAPVRAPEDYRLTFRTPPGCIVSNCTSFVGIDTNVGNNGVLDIYMEGEALGWVAVGFTATRNMFSADVVGCNRDPATNMVEVLDTYNAASPTRNNIVDQNQDVLLFNSSFDGTRIICTVAKQVAPLDPASQEDLNLNANLYVLWGIRPTDSTPGMLPAHAVGVGNNPAASDALVNPAGVVLATPVRAPADYRLVFSSPANCDPSTCDIFVGIDTNTGNPDFLDIYMEGTTQGWVAVGFSNSQSMFSSDVVGCNRDPNTGIITAVDTYNSDSPARANSLDATQDVVLFQGTSDNGRIRCSVAKQIAASDVTPPQDLDLNTPVFVMYGVGPTGSGANALLPHQLGPGGNPILSQGRFNPAADAGGDVPFPTVNLLRGHGIIMLITWPLLAVSGIFFAAWMRPALPNGEWFKIHQGFLLGSLFVGAIGFSLAFIANVPTGGLIALGSTNPVGTAHYVIGIIVMFLQILNPLIAACRCNPGDKYRWVFNVIHGSAIGLFVEILALVNIALGLTRFGPSSFFGDLTIFWVYIGYLIFFFVVIGVLFLMFTLLSLFSNEGERTKTIPSLIKPLVSDSPEKGQKPVPTNEGVELAVPGEKPTVPSDAPAKPKVPSKDAPIRWGALGIFLTVNVVMMVILIILIAIE